MTDGSTDQRETASDGPGAAQDGTASAMVEGDRIPPKRRPLVLAMMADWQLVLRFGAIVILVAACVVLLLHSFTGDGAGLLAAEFRIETALKVAALGFLILLITFLKGGWAVGVTLLGVLSLLIPTMDVIRLVTIATRPDTTIADLYPSNADVSVNTLYRSEALTNEIIEVVRKNLGNGTAASLSLERLREPVRTAIANHEIQRLVETVTSWSVDGLMLHLGEAAYEGDATAGLASWAFRYGDRPQFEADVARLRGLGLIRMNYDDVQSIELTWIGRRVADVLANEGQPLQPQDAAIPTAMWDDPLAQLTTPPGGCPTNVEGLPVLSLDAAVADAPLAVAGVSWFELSLTQETTLVLVAASQSIDPMIFLCRAGIGTALATNDDYETITYRTRFDVGSERIGAWAAAAAGVDSLRWSDAAILTALAPGRYLVGVRDYWGESGRFTLAATAVQP